MLVLTDLVHTQAFAQTLAQAICAGQLRHIFFQGTLGCGKTTCIRYLVEALPGSEMAQVASPSFSICNRYPVQPPILHCDLYRCQSDIPWELEEALEDPKLILLVEWSEFLPKELWPDEVLLVEFSRKLEERSLVLSAHGSQTAKLLPALKVPLTR